MVFYYCKCLTCNHTGNIKTGINNYTGNFVCSKCGSKDVISVYRDSEKTSTNSCISEKDDAYEEKAYYDDSYEYTVLEEERLLDALMMAPTGWEDDKEIQDYMGFSPEDISENSDVFYEDDMTFQEGGLVIANTSGRYATDACQFKPILIDEDVKDFLKHC